MVSLVESISLTPHETTLLVAFITLDYDLRALIKDKALTDEQALDFVSSPAVQSRLAGVKKFTNLADHLFNSSRRRKAIDTLVGVLDTSTDLVEKRKAATSLLRRTESNERPVNVRLPLAADGNRPDAGRGSLHSPPLLDPSTPLPASARLDSSPASILSALSRSLASPDRCDAVAIVQAVLTDNAKVEGEPIDVGSFKYDGGHPTLARLVHAVGHVHLSSDGSATQDTHRIATVGSDGKSVPMFIDFERNNLTSATERWKIRSIRRAGWHPDKGFRDTG